MDLHSVDGLSAWAAGHEELCTERHSAHKTRLLRIETLLIATFAAIIVGGCSVLWTLFQLGAKLAH